MYILQQQKDKVVRVLESYFTMVARDKNNRPMPLPPLLLHTDDEKRFFARGEGIQNSNLNFPAKSPTYSQKFLDFL